MVLALGRVPFFSVLDLALMKRKQEQAFLPLVVTKAAAFNGENETV